MAEYGYVVKAIAGGALVVHFTVFAANADRASNDPPAQWYDLPTLSHTTSAGENPFRPLAATIDTPAITQTQVSSGSNWG